MYNHPRCGKMYAYEVDGLGNYNLMDDANLPSLLAIPYLGYADLNDEKYINTRNFILSTENPESILENMHQVLEALILQKDIYGIYHLQCKG